MAVDAAAGSGKTSVLISRILKIVGADASDRADWARLGSVLAITFTEKAAAELRAKLRAHIPAAERFRLDQAWIGTFHAFCARLLRRFGPAAGLAASFDLLDENAAALLARKCVRDSLLNLLEKKNRPQSASSKRSGSRPQSARSRNSCSSAGTLARRSMTARMPKSGKRSSSERCEWYSRRLSVRAR